MLFLPERDVLLGGAGFVCFSSVAPVAAGWDVLVREALVGEPTPKFHTVRTIDLAAEKTPKRGVALPLSTRCLVSGPSIIGREKRENVLLTACGPARLVLPCLLLLLFFFASSIFRVATLSLSACFSSASVLLDKSVSRRPLSFPPSSSRTLTRFDIRLSSSS